MNILVTGCAGYVGSILCQQLLEDGHAVTGVDNLMYGNGKVLLNNIGHSRFGFHLGDVRDSYFMSKFWSKADVIIPLAAIVGAPACKRMHTQAIDINYRAIKEMLGTLSKQQRIIYPNTNSGYGQTYGQKKVTEDDPLTPVSHYGRTKVWAEEDVLQRENTISLRLATVFGVSPRMRFDLMVNDFTQKLVRVKRFRESIERGYNGIIPYREDDLFLTVFDPEYKRNFVHVRDVARVFSHLMTDGFSGAYNVGLPDANLSKMELALLVAGLVGLYPPLVVRTGEGHDPDNRNYLVDNTRLLNTGFTFEHTLNDGIRGVIDVCNLFTDDILFQMRNA